MDSVDLENGESQYWSTSVVSRQGVYGGYPLKRSRATLKWPGAGEYQIGP